MIRRIAIALIACALAAQAQQTLGTVNTETPEGVLLQKIGQENDPAARMTALEEFFAKYPKHESAGWVLSQMQQAHLKGNQFDKALAAGEKLAALDPNDLEAAHNNLKAAEGMKNPAKVLTWAEATSKLARATAAKPKPADEGDVEHWKSMVDFSKQLDTYTEYSLFAAAAGTTDANARIALADSLRKRNAKSQYMGQMADLEFAALTTLPDTAKTMATAEAAIAGGTASESILLFAADQYSKRKDHAKVMATAEKASQQLEAKTRPEGVPEADWNIKKGLALFLFGSSAVESGKYQPADQALRKALPLVETNEQLKAGVLFYASLANNSLGNFADALNFARQAAAIKGPLAGRAAENAKALATKVPATKKKK